MEGEAQGPGSVTRRLLDLRAGDPAAAEALWGRYFDRLVRLARVRLRASSRASADADEEDAALSAFDSFCGGAAEGRFADLADRDELWRLLVVITARKVAAQVRRATRQKRGGGRVVGASDLPRDGPDAESALLDRVIGREPTPEFAAMVAEAFEDRMRLLDDESLREVARLRMDGYTRDEIADRLGCARRTVARRLGLIRRIWSDPAD